MPKFRDNIGAISKGAMVMMCIMFFYLGNLITSDEILSKKLLYIGIDWIRVMHSTLLYDNYFQNIIHTAIIVSLTSYNFAILKRIKWKLQQLLVTYLEVVCTKSIVTYCKLIGSGRLLWTIDQYSRTLSELETYSRNPLSAYLSVACVICIVTLCSIISPGKLIELIKSLNIEVALWNIYLNIVCITPIVISNSITSPGKLIEFVNSFNVEARSFSTYLEIVCIQSIVTSGSIISPGKLIETLKKYSEYPRIVYTSHNISARSIISSGKLIEIKTVQFKRFYSIDQITNVLFYVVKLHRKVDILTLLGKSYFFVDKYFISYRSWSCRDLQSAASEATYSTKERRVKQSDTVLVPHIDGIHGTGNPKSAWKFPVDKMTVANRIVGYTHSKKWHTDNYMDVMEEFMNDLPPTPEIAIVLED